MHSISSNQFEFSPFISAKIKSCIWKRKTSYLIRLDLIFMVPGQNTNDYFFCFFTFLSSKFEDLEGKIQTVAYATLSPSRLKRTSRELLCFMRMCLTCYVFMQFTCHSDTIRTYSHHWIFAIKWKWHNICHLSFIACIRWNSYFNIDIRLHSQWHKSS